MASGFVRRYMTIYTAFGPIDAHIHSIVEVLRVSFKKTMVHPKSQIFFTSAGKIDFICACVHGL